MLGKKDFNRVYKEYHSKIRNYLARLLGDQEAEDATQEILIKVMTNLSGFRQKSSFKTWVYKISLHHLLNIRRKRIDKLNITFEHWEELIDADRGDVRLHSRDDQEKAMLINETRSGCLQGLLQCLDKNVRAAFILGEIFEFSGKEGAWILSISPEAFRKRLSRGREQLYAFMAKNCGLLNSSNRCKCSEQVERDIHLGLIDPGNLDFSNPEEKNDPLLDISAVLAELDDMGKMISLFRTYPRYSSPDSAADMVKELIASNDFRLFQ
mgnify:CR=1 FL=1